MLNVKDFIIISISLIVMLMLSWVGFGGGWGDDWLYSEAALGWLSNGLHVGVTHWQLRYPHVLPIAASYALFGFGEFQLIFPTTIFFALTVFIVYRFLNEFAGRPAALISCLLLVITPLMIVSATIPVVDITEAFFVILSGILFWRAAKDAAPARTLFFAGVAAGLGWATRETSAGLLAAFGLMFLAGHRYPRGHYLIMAAGAAVVAAIEAIYMAVMTGNPLYRYKIDFLLQAADMETRSGVGGILPGIGEAVSSVKGNFSAHWLIDPIMALLINQEFGLIFWVGVPLGLWLCFSRKVDGDHRDLARFLTLLAVTWFVTISYVAGVRELPRYFAVPAIVAAILTGIWSAHYRSTVSRTVWIVLAGFLVSANLFAIYIENKNILYAERKVAQLIAENPETVYTDKITATRISHLFKIKHVPVSVRRGPPPPGALYIYNPRNLANGQIHKDSRDPEASLPRPEWRQIGYFDPGRRYIGIVLEMAGLKQFIPEHIYAKLNYPNAPLAAYRLPGGASGENGLE